MPPHARPRTTLPALVALAAFSGCGDASGDRGGFRVETLNGISHSVADAAPLQDGPVLELAWEAPSEADVLDGSAWSDPGQLAAGVGGVAVADAQIARVHLFTADGRRAGSFGRRGEGPGELAGGMTIALHGDTVFVQSGMRPAIQLFRRSGEHVGSIGATDGMSSGFTFLPGTGFLRSVFTPTPGQSSASWSILGLDGEPRDVELPGTHPLQPQAQEVGEGCWRRGGLGSNVVEVDCTFPLLRVVDPSGTVIREHRIDRSPIEVTPEMLRIVVDRRRQAMSAELGAVPAAQRQAMQGLIDQMLRQTEEQFRWLPVMRGVAGSPSGHRIVVWEQVPQEFEAEESVLHVLDGEGRYLVREPIDAPLAAMAVGDELLYVLRIDGVTGLKRLVAYRLP